MRDLAITYGNSRQAKKLIDLHDLQKNIDQEDPEGSTLDSFSLELFEDISYIMAKHADPKGVPDTPDEWLDQFGTFSIYQVLPEIIELWGIVPNNKICFT